MNPLSISWWRNVSQRMGRGVGWGCLIIFGVPLVIGFALSNYTGRGPSGPSPTERSGTIVTVNGEPITEGEFARAASSVQSGAPGDRFAQIQGQVLYSLIVYKVVEQMAQKANIHPSDADIDQQVQTAREQLVGKNASESDWENYIDQRYHQSLPDFREQIAKDLTIKTLLDSYQKAEQVTPEEARNQSAEVNITSVLVPTQGGLPMLSPGLKPLPDADAKKKADDLHAKVQGGADIYAVAKAAGAQISPTKPGPDWRGEDQASALAEQAGALGFGPAFDDAVHKTAKGQLTDIVKSNGFQSGYVFARVVDRRNNIPKDFDEKKALADLKQQRAGKKLNDAIKANVKAAKIDFPKDAVDKKAYYDYFKMQEMRQEQQMAMFGQGAPDAPTAADIEKQQTLIDNDFEAVLRANPKDPTANLLVASAVKRRLFSAPPAQQAQMNDRLISLYETALKDTEDHQLRLDLADLYRDKKEYKLADAQYKTISKQLDADPPYDMNTMQQAQTTRQKLERG